MPLLRCVGDYRMNAAGYDSGNNRLIDQSGLNFHLPLAFGSAPVFTTRDGFDCLDLDNTFYFEARNPIVAIGTVIMVVKTTVAGSPDGNLDVLAFRDSRFGNGDYPGDVPLTPWESYDRRFFGVAGATSTTRVGDRAGGDPVAAAAYTSAQWAVWTGVWNAIELKSKVKKNDATAVEDDAPPTGAQCQYIEDTMRYGYLKSVAWVTGGRYLSVAQWRIYRDDLISNQATALAAEIAALKALYGIA